MRTAVLFLWALFSDFFFSSICFLSDYWCNEPVLINGCLLKTECAPSPNRNKVISVVKLFTDEQSIFVFCHYKSVLNKFCSLYESVCIETVFLLFFAAAVVLICLKFSSLYSLCVFSPGVILCGWLGSKHQLTNFVCVMCFSHQEMVQHLFLFLPQPPSSGGKVYHGWTLHTLHHCRIERGAQHQDG